jgi:hypothetical protein
MTTMGTSDNNKVFARTLMRTELMKFRCLIVALALTTAATDSEAGPLRRRARSADPYPTYQQPTVTPPAGYTIDPAPVAMPVTPAGEYTTLYTPVSATESQPQIVVTGSVMWSAGDGDGLDEVNAKRAAHGLRPFVRDEGLTQAARACAAFRAEHGLFGHTSNDFAFVPPGAAASSAGCAAYPASYGWMSCCTYDNHTSAGAAWVTGRDGRRYMHLFVR